MSMRPNASTVDWTRRWMMSARLTSPTKVRARRPAPRICSAVLSTSRQPIFFSSSGYVAGSRPVPVTTTSAPSPARASAVARPIPRSRPAPVTSATLPSSELMWRSFRAAGSDEARAILPERAEVGHVHAAEGRGTEAAVVQIEANHAGGGGIVGVVDGELHCVAEILVGVGEHGVVEPHARKVRDEELGGSPRLELAHDLRGDARLVHARMRIDDAPVRA